MKHEIILNRRAYITIAMRLKEVQMSSVGSVIEGYGAKFSFEEFSLDEVCCVARIAGCFGVKCSKGEWVENGKKIQMGATEGQ